ncbi:histidine phosphatase family protein [Brevundimonas sp.]|uniref:SixA phosphatase family protein n=1 Tax=Brevundimonas sp. TaxID=1871086 RepID=UPI0035AE900C
MNRLIIMRHAEAGRAPTGQGDRDRPLTERGVADARAMGRWLAGKGLAPDGACVSPARRTRQTWDHASASFGDADLDCDENLYDAGPDTLRRAVEGAAGRAGVFMLVAHNPGVHALGLDLLAEGGAALADVDRLQRGFPPGAAAVFRREGGRWTFEAFWTPADIEALP